MKATNFSKPTVESNGIKDSVKFGIKASGLHHILGILRNQLYSDKILAVIREYTCNAVDAHTEAMRPERPIEVTLPNRMNPNFKVRDFGPALSDDDIHNIYAFYGESTKRNTNDQIGMLGIGSKAAFAYGDNFVINSFLNGKKNTYNAFIDPSQVGQISKLSTEDSDEEDGIEIVVPVNDDDSDEFVTKAKDLFEWFKVRPIIHGHKQFEYNDERTLFSGNGWKWTDYTGERYHRKNEAIVVMGNIGYPIDKYALNLKHDDDYSNLLTDNLILNVEIGDLEISASREKLQYTDYTRENLKKTLKRVQEELATVIGKEFDGCKTLFDAKCLYGSTFTTTSPLYAVKDVIKKHLMWKGKPVGDSTFNCYNVSGVTLHKFKQGFRGGSKYRPEEKNSIHCDKNVVMIENDLGHRRGIMGRMLPFIITQGKKPYLIQFEATAADGSGKGRRTAAQVKAKFFKDEKFDGELIKLSSLPQHKLSEFGYGPTSKGGTYVKNSKHAAKCFAFDKNASLSSWHVPKSDFWDVTEADVENESGVYVIIDKFCVVKNDEYATSTNPKNLKTITDLLKNMKIKVPKIHAFKVGQRNKIEGKKGWSEFYSWVEGVLLEQMEAQKLLQKYVDRNHAKDFARNSDVSNANQLMSFIKDNGVFAKLADSDGTLAKLIKREEECRHTPDSEVLDSFREVAGELGMSKDMNDTQKKLKPTHDLTQLMKEVGEKYEMIQHIEHSALSWNKNSFVEPFVNYVNVIDVCNKS